MTGVAGSAYLHTTSRRICHLASLRQLQKYTHAANTCVVSARTRICPSLLGFVPFALFEWRLSSTQTAPNSTELLRGNVHLSSAAFYRTVIWVKVSSRCSFIYFGVVSKRSSGDVCRRDWSRYETQVKVTGNRSLAPPARAHRTASAPASAAYQSGTSID